MTDAPTSLALTFKEVDQQTWPDLEKLFESRGGPKYCWCMAWRSSAGELKQNDRVHRKAALKSRVDEAVPIGLVGYLAGEPVAWCSIAPRSTYRRLGGYEDETPENVWSFACFFITRRLRSHGAVAQMIAAGIEHARQKGATIVEAYPVDPDSPSYRFMGYVESFRAFGFEEVGMAGSRRHVLRKRV